MTGGMSPAECEQHDEAPEIHRQYRLAAIGRAQELNRKSEPEQQRQQ